MRRKRTEEGFLIKSKNDHRTEIIRRQLDDSSYTLIICASLIASVLTTSYYASIFLLLFSFVLGIYRSILRYRREKKDSRDGWGKK